MNGRSSGRTWNLALLLGLILAARGALDLGAWSQTASSPVDSGLKTVGHEKAVGSRTDGRMAEYTTRTKRITKLQLIKPTLQEVKAKPQSYLSKS